MNNFINEATLFLPALVLFFTVPLVISNVAAIIFSYTREKSDAAAALSFIGMFLNFIGVLVFSLLNIRSALVFPVALLVAIISISILTIRLKVK